MFWSLFVAKFFLFSLFFCKHKFYTLRHIKIIELLMGNVLSWWIYSVKYSYLGPIFAYLLPVAAGESQVIYCSLILPFVFSESAVGGSIQIFTTK